MNGVRERLTSRTFTGIAVVIAVLWTTPTLGLLVSSFRPEEDIKTTGWWTLSGTPHLTLDNYAEVLSGGGNGAGRLAEHFVNSVVITVPSVLFPLVLAFLAAYALAWIDFRGRDALVVGIFALQAVPLQMALVPLLKLFSQGWLFPPAWHLTGPARFGQVWFAHTAFALPFAVFLLHNFLAGLPRELIEAARVDGASHGTLLLRIVLPPARPALAGFAVIQFVWVWNDLLVALTLSGGTSGTAPMTVRLASMAGTYGNEWHRLTAGAFVAALVPLLVFFTLRRHFARGLLAGSVKG
ncbi:carbohydrate ABC transporter permease [Streptomyces lavendulae]|uniref:carbohydrate ABC transporter permease n=1 Tax=Streptomyces lavendulae TaxID=1914 RepID=UPI0024A0C8F3|nr:carbohydrate ABC transporter permease [Streptomyces lavendulae]GLX22691.1 sugar ABC transporter permease [Streptomyces lavendulae subsp. lavendulae]GLX24219.1 sugar ABC transporter permease [Streptomyces lavendulae subsp. lavendulae]